MPQRVIFLDRDGTINVDHGYVSRIEEWQFLPGAVAALQLQAGWTLATVTNQSGIAAGYYNLERRHRHVVDELEKHRVHLNAIAYCPHSTRTAATAVIRCSTRLSA